MGSRSISRQWPEDPLSASRGGPPLRPGGNWNNSDTTTIADGIKMLFEAWPADPLSTSRGGPPLRPGGNWNNSDNNSHC